MSRNYMSRYDQLFKGDYLESNNGKFKAVFQDDGNFVIYNIICTPQVVWSSDTNGADGTRLCLQSDCNLVMYDSCNQLVWLTGLISEDGIWVRLTLTDEGVLVLQNKSKVVWRSDQDCGKKA